jgi:hypothetical protein
LNRVFEQRSIVEENTEQAYFELRGFLMNQITNAYSRHIRTLYKEQDPGVTIQFSTRLDFCLTNKLVPYLQKHTRRDNIEEIIITHDILAELKRTIDHIEGITTMEDLGKELSGFEYTSRKLGGKAQRVLALLLCLRDKPFWIWDTKQHKQEDIKTKGDCCFNHIIGF